MFTIGIMTTDKIIDIAVKLTVMLMALGVVSWLVYAAIAAPLISTLLVIGGVLLFCWLFFCLIWLIDNSL